jgi:hypothetical protein
LTKFSKRSADFWICGEDSSKNCKSSDRDWEAFAKKPRIFSKGFVTAIVQGCKLPRVTANDKVEEDYSKSPDIG